MLFGLKFPLMALINHLVINHNVKIDFVELTKVK